MHSTLASALHRHSARSAAQCDRITDADPFMSELLSYPHSELIGKELGEIGLLKDEEASQFTAACVPHPRGVIRRRGGDALAVGTEPRAPNSSRMPLEQAFSG